MLRFLSVILFACSLFGQTSSYPGAIDNDSTLFVTADNVQTQLAAAMAVGDSGASVISTSGFVANMLVTVCDTMANTGKCTAWEDMLVTSISGSTLNVTRAQAGTSVRAHAIGAFVSVLIDSAHQRALKSAVLALETTLGANLVNAQGSFRSAASYNFTAQTPGGTLVQSGANQAITLTPCPLGVNGTDKNHMVYLSGGTGTAEGTPITGGTCTSGAATGTITVTPAQGHSGAWTVQSATGGIEEAMSALPAAGGTVVLPAGNVNLYGNPGLTLGNGVGTTQSTVNNILLLGQGFSSANPSFSSASVLTYAGVSGGTAVRIQGPANTMRLQNVTVDGGGLASILYDHFACANCGLEAVTLRNIAAGGIAHRIDAVADYNGNSAHSFFRDVNVTALASGASCLQIGPTALNYNAGNFSNLFENYNCTYANDVAGSYGVQLGWADNNEFLHSSFVASAQPGAGYPLVHVRQAGTYSWLPSENVFNHVNLGCVTCLPIYGNSGSGIGTIFSDYQVFDSSGLPAQGAVKNLRGQLHNGDWFDTDTTSRFNFQNLLTIYSASSFAMLRFPGYTGSTDAGATLQTTGTAVVGTNSHFLTKPGKGRMIVLSNELRYLASVSDDTHATLNQAFTDDAPAGTSYLYQVGANGYIYTDSAAHLGTQDASPVRIDPGAITAIQAQYNATSGGGDVGVSGIFSATAADTGLSNGGGNTLTAAMLIGGQIRRTGGGAQTDTTDTAANIVAAIPNCQVGQIFQFVIYNNSGGQHVLGLGSGVTAAAGLTPTLTTANTYAHAFQLRVTNVGAGSQAVAIYSLGSGAY